MLWWILPALLGGAVGYLMNSAWKNKYLEIQKENNKLRDSNVILKTKAEQVTDEIKRTEAQLSGSEAQVSRLRSQKEHLLSKLATTTAAATTKPATIEATDDPIEEPRQEEPSAQPVSELISEPFKEEEVTQELSENEVISLEDKNVEVDQEDNHDADLAEGGSDLSQQETSNSSSLTNNLQVINGIGSRMETVLHENGIHTWEQLSHNSKSQLDEILSKYGSKFTLIDTTHWADQARLASQGQWEELIAFQETQISGSQTGGQSKAKAFLSKHGIIQDDTDRSDLKAFEGIGSRIETILNQNGIHNWNELAATPVVKLRGVLADADPIFKMVDPSSWPKQAQLAITGKNDILKEYQDFLKSNT